MGHNDEITLPFLSLSLFFNTHSDEPGKRKYVTFNTCGLKGSHISICLRTKISIYYFTNFSKLLMLNAKTVND